MSIKILLINGPNLNLLGTREPSKYGSENLESIINALHEEIKGVSGKITSLQSNSEGEIVDYIQKYGPSMDYLIINPAAYTHTSVAIRDAILAVDIPVIEVHISNIYKREDFRRKSYISDIAIGVISGLGVFGYHAALQFVMRDYKKNVS